MICHDLLWQPTHVFHNVCKPAREISRATSTHNHYTHKIISDSRIHSSPGFSCSRPRQTKRGNTTSATAAIPSSVCAAPLRCYPYRHCLVEASIANNDFRFQSRSGKGPTETTGTKNKTQLLPSFPYMTISFSSAALNRWRVVIVPIRTNKCVWM